MPKIRVTDLDELEEMDEAYGGKVHTKKEYKFDPRTPEGFKPGDKHNKRPRRTHRTPSGDKEVQGVR